MPCFCVHRRFPGQRRRGVLFRGGRICGDGLHVTGPPQRDHRQQYRGGRRDQSDPPAAGGPGDDVPGGTEAAGSG